MIGYRKERSDLATNRGVGKNLLRGSAKMTFCEFHWTAAVKTFFADQYFHCYIWELVSRCCKHNGIKRHLTFSGGGALA